jgi:hypothetical protein
VVALAVRILVTAVYSRHHVTVTGLELGTIADRLLEGRGFVWEFYGSTEPRYSFFPPFYPAFLALLKLVFAGGEPRVLGAWVPAMQAVQAAFSALTAVAARRLGARVLRPGRDWWAGYAVAFWPPLVIYSASAYSTTFEALGVTLILIKLVDAGRSRRLSDAAGAGALYGALAYALPAFLGTLLFVPAGLRALGVRWGRALVLTGTALAVALLVVSPWTVRNALIHHRLVPVATNLGFNYLGGQNPYARPHTNVLCGFDDIRWRVIDRTALATMNEVDFDNSLLRQGLAFARDEPVVTVRRSVGRFVAYWWGTPAILRYNPDQGLANLILMTCVLPLFVVGLFRGRRTARGAFGLLIAVFVWQSLFYMNFAVRGRYVLPIHPLILIVAVAGADSLIAAAKGGRREEPSPSDSEGVVPPAGALRGARRSGIS